MEEAKKQEVEQKCEEVERKCKEARAEEERKAAEAEEVQRAKVGKKQKAAGSINEDGSEVLEGFAKGELCYLCRKAEVICYWPDKYVFLFMSSI